MAFFVTFDADGRLATRLIKGVHSIPKDATQVDEDTWYRITQETDGIWSRAASGEVVKRSFEVDPQEQAAREMAAERVWRNAEIARVSWLRDRHRDELDLNKATSLSGDQFAELLTYMQALRDWPESGAFPATDGRPQPPGWIADQSQ